MDLVSMRIRLFRTIGHTDIELPLDRYLTIVGPNNSGKTNLLRAIQMFFTGHENELHYSRPRDFTFSGGTGKTSLLATFRVADDSVEDAHIIAQLNRLYDLYGLSHPQETFSLSLVFSPSDVPTYQFLPNTKKPEENSVQTQISRTQKQLVTDLLSRFSCHYVPSEKSVRQLYDEVLNPFLKKAAAEALRPQMGHLVAALESVSERINNELAHAGLRGLHAAFSVPDGSLEALLDRFDFRMSDPVDTALTFKGQGIQSTAFFAALRWVSEEEQAKGLKSIWLLEEPEAYLHPELMPTVHGLLERVAEISTVAVSTHSLSFVPADPKTVLGTRLKDGFTEAVRYPTYAEATQAIRSSLGVRFSDFYNLGRFNLALEGKSDREMISWYLTSVDKDVLPLSRLREAHLLDFGGVKQLSGWLRATYQYVRMERALVSVFDGDLAGEKERKDLNQYFGNQKIPFQANRHYLVVRAGFSIESLFPDAWISQINEDHPNWFEDHSVDVSGALVAFKVNDSEKSRLQKALMRKADQEPDTDWRERWDNFALAAEEALRLEDERFSS
ncbi:ATP-dependent nuclease [Raineyella sp. LH-20]|uniref:ATP-dependent nuclease n=1 Tax=Raineyella sp. LH-20 TaxID=3081204 RepID=UPI0029532AA5|nr:AAA family ATPase [Raineyella sp. LH-20]WOP18837.1 AAA family ATPase [Raineyella sp. LH-20]